MFASAYKRGVAGPNEIQNGGQIKKDNKLLALQPAYNERNALAKRVYTGHSR